MKKIYILSGVVIAIMLTLLGVLFYQHHKDAEKINECETYAAELSQQYTGLNNEYRTLKEAYDKLQASVSINNSNSSYEMNISKTDGEQAETDEQTDADKTADADEQTDSDELSDETGNISGTDSETVAIAEKPDEIHEAPESQPANQPESQPATPQAPKPEQRTYTYSWGQNLRYVAIGNSITIHGENEYWWSNMGMSATSIDKDYVHLVEAALCDLTGSASAKAYNFYPWEVQVNDRAETFTLLDFLLDEQPDIISLQLSENVIDMSHYESDWEELIRYIQGKCPDTQIIIIDDFWYGGNKSTLKKQAADNTGVQFVSLSAIRNNTAYQCGMGTIIYDAQWNPHVVEHEGVAKHPNDSGMQYIADGIMSYIR